MKIRLKILKIIENATDSFNFKTKITGQTNDDGEINGVEIMFH